MTATIAASQAILKTKYPDGKLPKTQFTKAPFVASLTKKEDFDGNNKQIALQTENPQGSSADFPTALGSLAQGTYKNFLLTRVQHFGVARITGQAMKAAEKSSGALVDLWKNETDGISTTELMNLEIYSFGAGDGVLGTIVSGTTTTVLTLATVSDAVKFSLGMRLQAVSATGLSPTLRAGFVVVSAIDRVLGTLTTTSGAWNAAGNIPGILNTDSLVRMGDNALAGTSAVVTGIGQYIVGGASPATLFGLVRSGDTARLAGNLYNATTVPYSDAIIEAESLRDLQYQGAMDTVMWANPRDIAQWKKQLSGKETFPRTEMKSTVAGVSFSAIEYAGNNGPIKIMTSPFLSRNTAYLLEMDSFALESIGPAPQMLNYDGPNFLRVANDDAYEVRFGFYGNISCNKPVASIQISNFGA